MFHAAAKLIALVILPSALGLILATLGLLALVFATRRRLGAWLAFTGIAILAIGGFSPLANIALYPLEQRFADAPLPKPTDNVAGIIILGGFEDAWVSAGRPGLGLNEAAERLTEGIRLARRWPNAKVVFTGGVSSIFPHGNDATGPVGDYLIDAGIDRSRIVLEGKSRDTFENAVLTKKLVAPQPGDTWLLVTSAFHTPRSMGVFRRAGFDVTAAPVDFRTRDRRDFWKFFERPSRGLLRMDVVTKEWIGLGIYWLTGRSNALFPAPTPPGQTTDAP